MYKWEYVQEIGKKRWLNPKEILYILSDQSFRDKFCVETLPKQADIGSVFLIKICKKNKWKEDGYLYIKRNNGIGFKESSEILSIDGKKLMTCLYSNVSLEDQVCNEKISNISNGNLSGEKTFQRRIFKPIKGQVEESVDLDLVVVQYFTRGKDCSYTNTRVKKNPKSTNYSLPMNNQCCINDK